MCDNETVGVRWIPARARMEPNGTLARLLTGMLGGSPRPPVKMNDEQKVGQAVSTRWIPALQGRNLQQEAHTREMNTVDIPAHAK